MVVEIVREQVISWMNLVPAGISCPEMMVVWWVCLLLLAMWGRLRAVDVRRWWSRW